MSFSKTFLKHLSEEKDLFPPQKCSTLTTDEPLGYRPLADRLRPQALKDVIGQEHLTSEEGVLKRMVRFNSLSSLILWGNPGIGKTTIAQVLSQESKLNYSKVSAIFSGVSDLRKIFDEAEKNKRLTGEPTLLFVDEIHRFNRSQQDSFLPFVENGTIILVGATTENPSFTLNNALLSRCKILVLHAFKEKDFVVLLEKAEAFLKIKFQFSDEARSILFRFADGDARVFLNTLEQIHSQFKNELVDVSMLENILQKRAHLYDKNQDEHYNLTSALHKSLRGSDPDAALYWYARMVEGGEDLNYIARRLTRFAAEDIGLASPNALMLSISAWQAYDRLGSPEGEIVLAELVVYLATCSKSNSVYKAFNKARDIVRKTGSLMPPKHILNAPNAMMKNLGYGEGYQYDHNTKEGISGQNYFPDSLKKQEIYSPSQNGMEEAIFQRINYWKQLKNKKPS
ncbi:Replication-associated recombination protein A [Commensalibacter sp. Nvir]|uniref:replication-associated recombination protein A n=1 Tax=Commensalibacter sp. Nvir TaxID=3069817 RepID=UPI002D5D5382|nr:Replication-associated recombination protein A [Commensalibacter sp. Nvir]